MDDSIPSTEAIHTHQERLIRLVLHIEELAAKLERYSLDLSAQPSPAAEKAPVVLLGQVMAIVQEVVSIFVDPHALRESGGHNGLVALQGVQRRVGQGSLRLAEIADEFYATASLYRNCVCAELSDQLRSLDADSLARFGFFLAPYAGLSGRQGG